MIGQVDKAAHSRYFNRILVNNTGNQSKERGTTLNPPSGEHFQRISIEHIMDMVLFLEINLNQQILYNLTWYLKNNLENRNKNGLVAYSFEPVFLIVVASVYLEHCLEPLEEWGGGMALASLLQSVPTLRLLGLM